MLYVVTERIYRSDGRIRGFICDIAQTRFSSTSSRYEISNVYVSSTAPTIHLWHLFGVYFYSQSILYMIFGSNLLSSDCW